MSLFHSHLHNLFFSINTSFIEFEDIYRGSGIHYQMQCHGNPRKDITIMRNVAQWLADLFEEEKEIHAIKVCMVQKAECSSLVAYADRRTAPYDPDLSLYVTQRLHQKMEELKINNIDIFRISNVHPKYATSRYITVCRRDIKTKDVSVNLAKKLFTGWGEKVIDAECRMME
ncbi:hypothetical protein ACBP93_06470 [Paenalcaligenes hominis]|uniref:hypothetical protein n=1 Tax=Paenalcaligenes hominis TaxID=643674 RepID=UPI003526B673